MIREIVLDTETTSTDSKVDRLIEVGCVELVNHTPTGRTFHRYCNPQRAVHPDALAVHGLADAFLADKLLFVRLPEPQTATIRSDLVVATPLAAHREHATAAINLDALAPYADRGYHKDIFMT